MDLSGDEAEEPFPLPPEAFYWNARMIALWRQTLGQLDPASAGSEKCVPGRVSVVTPTTEARRRFHQILYLCFAQQVWPNKELVVVDTYVDSPSDFLESQARRDPRLTYAKFQRPRGSDWSIGLKRNIGTHLATGEFIANFDDDDLYAPRYLTTLVEDLCSRRALGVTLSTWYIFDTETSTFGYCNPMRWGWVKGYGETHHRVRKMTYGYGFSYVYRRQAALRHPYPDQGMGEDYKFFRALMTAHGESCIGLHEDTAGICLHTLHPGSTSDSIALWEVDREEIRDLDISECDSLVAYTFQYPKKQERKNKHILDWAGNGEHLRMNPQRLYREVIAHTSFGNYKATCRRGASKREFIEAVEEQIGALPVDTMVFRMSANAQAPLEDNERLGSYTTDLWLVLPGETRETDSSGGSSGSGAGARGRSSSAVHVTVPAASAKPPSVSRIFHVDLPLEASVADLRARLLPLGMAPTSQVFAFLPGGGRVELDGLDPVPPKVALSAFQGEVRHDMVLTHAQAHELLARHIHALEQPEMQARLDELEAKAAGDFNKYFHSMSKHLNLTVDRSMVRHFGLQDDDRGPALLRKAVEHFCQDTDGVVGTFHFESLRRNRPAVKMYMEEPQWAWLRERLQIEAPQTRQPRVREASSTGPPQQEAPAREAARRDPPPEIQGAAQEAPGREGGRGAPEGRGGPGGAYAGVGRGGAAAESVRPELAREGPEASRPRPSLQEAPASEAAAAAGEGQATVEAEAAAAPIESAPPHLPQLWAVVGGATRGGIVVREGADTGSAMLPRLRFGAVVLDLEREGERIRFAKLSGDGPKEGWVSLKLTDGKALLMQGKALEVLGSKQQGGGIRVWQEEDTGSGELPRLSAGALVFEIAVHGSRMQYFKISGDGPAVGWVNRALPSGQDLVVAAKLWLVVGRQSRGGVVVRSDDHARSPVEIQRLEPGSVVLQRERKDSRLLYSLLLGSGPPGGWVNIGSLEQRLLVPI